MDNLPFRNEKLTFKQVRDQFYSGFGSELSEKRQQRSTLESPSLSQKRHDQQSILTGGDGVTGSADLKETSASAGGLEKAKPGAGDCGGAVKIESNNVTKNAGAVANQPNTKTNTNSIISSPQHKMESVLPPE